MKFSVVTSLLYLTILCIAPFYARAAIDPSPCFKDLQLHFFQEPIVGQAFGLYEIPQGLWVPVMQSLQRRGLEIPNRLKDKTARLVRNPIDFPMDKKIAAQLLIATLFEVFLETMQEYQIQEQPTAHLIFDYILSKQADKFIGCFGEVVRPLIPSPNF